MKPVRLSIEADAEFTAARKWYAEIDAYLGERFFQIVRLALRSIEQHPAAWPPYDGVYRHYPLRKFPYTIFYTELEEFVLVDAIAHHSRRPNYWQKHT